MNSAQLMSRGKELEKRLEDLVADETMSKTDKSTAMKALTKEIEDHGHDVAISRGAEEARKSLNLGDAAPDAEPGGPDVRDFAPNLKGMNRHFARQIIKSSAYAQMVRDLGGPRGADSIGARGTFDHKFEIGVPSTKGIPFGDVGLKDASQTGNTMGEGFYGSGTPTGITTSPPQFFLSGAYGPGIIPQFLPGIVEQRLYELTISDLFQSIPSTSPDMTYLVESVLNEQAGAVAEGGTYPFSSNEFARKVEQIGKVANAVQVTDELIRDAQYLFTFLQTRLIEGVQRQEEVQLLAGGGYPGVNGLLNRASSFTMGQTGSAVATGSSIAFPAAGTSGAGVQSATISSLPYGRQALGAGSTGTPPTALDIAVTLYSAIVDIQMAVFYSPSAIVMNPLDFKTLRLGTDNNGQFYAGSMWGQDYGYASNSPAGNGYLGGSSNKLWNVPVVQTPVMPQGTALVGYFGPEAAQVARREGLSLQMTNFNGTNFVDGEVTLRAEERLGLMVYRPAAFELVQIAPAP